MSSEEEEVGISEKEFAAPVDALLSMLCCWVGGGVLFCFRTCFCADFFCRCDFFVAVDVDVDVDVHVVAVVAIWIVTGFVSPSRELFARPTVLFVFRADVLLSVLLL